MIELKENEDLIYRCLLRGLTNVKTIVKATGKSNSTVRDALAWLEAYELVRIEKVSSRLVFEVIEKEVVVKKKTRKLEEKQITADGIPRSELDLTKINYAYTDQQKAAIEVYKRKKTYNGEQMERTPFARAIGVPKLYVNFALEAR